ncbi:MAG TPA: aspartyl protease family protein [Nitrososphaerales archaeon]|nr:aspartyl protease family protein [Nitrososphaerales archaeon]
MSAFVGLAPVVRVRLRNLPLGMEYPKGGSLEAVVDTGYGGFVAVPRDVFEALGLHKMVTTPRKVEVADGRVVRSVVAYGTVELEPSLEVDGPIETMKGLTEVLVGTRLLAGFRMTLDYCLRVVSVRPCP